MIQIDLEMPKCCYDCRLVYDSCWCMITGSSMDWEKNETERLPDCPLADITNIKAENIRLKNSIENIINMLNEEIKKEEKESGRYGMYYTVELYEQVLKMIEGEIYDS